MRVVSASHPSGAKSRRARSAVAGHRQRLDPRSPAGWPPRPVPAARASCRPWRCGTCDSAPRTGRTRRRRAGRSRTGPPAPRRPRHRGLRAPAPPDRGRAPTPPRSAPPSLPERRRARGRAARLDLVQPVRVLHQQEAEVGGWPVGGGDGQEHRQVLMRKPTDARRRIQPRWRVRSSRASRAPRGARREASNPNRSFRHGRAAEHRLPALPAPDAARPHRAVRGVLAPARRAGAPAVEGAGAGAGGHGHRDAAGHDPGGMPAARPPLRARRAGRGGADGGRGGAGLPAPAGGGGALRHLRLHGRAGAGRGGAAARQAGHHALGEPRLPRIASAPRRSRRGWCATATCSPAAA